MSVALCSIESCLFVTAIELTEHFLLEGKLILYLFLYYSICVWCVCYYVSFLWSLLYFSKRCSYVNNLSTVYFLEILLCYDFGSCFSWRHCWIVNSINTVSKYNQLLVLLSYIICFLTWKSILFNCNSSISTSIQSSAHGSFWTLSWVFIFILWSLNHGSLWTPWSLCVLVSVFLVIGSTWPHRKSDIHFS